MKFISILKLKYAFTYLKALLYTKIEANNLFATKESVYTKTAANDAFAPKSTATTVGDSNGGLVKDVNGLKTTVGDSGNGLVKDVNDLKTAVGGFPNGLKNRVLGLEFTVGDNLTGLVKDVSGLKTTVGNSNSGIIKDVNGLKTTVGDSSSGVVKDVNTLKTTVGDNNSGLVKTVNTLSATVGSSNSGLVQSVSSLQTTVGNSISGLVKDVNGLQSSVSALETLTYYMSLDNNGTDNYSIGEEFLYLGSTFTDSDVRLERSFGQVYQYNYAFPIILDIKNDGDDPVLNYPLLNVVIEKLKPFLAYQTPIKIYADGSGAWNTITTDQDSYPIFYYIKYDRYNDMSELTYALDNLMTEISQIQGIVSASYQFSDELAQCITFDDGSFDGYYFDFLTFIPKYSLLNIPNFTITAV